MIARRHRRPCVHVMNWLLVRKEVAIGKSEELLPER